MSTKAIIAKEYLIQVKEKNEAIKRAKERYVQDHELIFGGGGIDYSKEHVDGGKVETGNKAVEMMVDRWGEIHKMEQDYLEITKQIAEQVEQVTTYHGKEVLTRRYLLIPKNGRLTSFEQITEDLGLEAMRHCQRIHANALEEIYDKFLKNKSFA